MSVRYWVGKRTGYVLGIHLGHWLADRVGKLGLELGLVDHFMMVLWYGWSEARKQCTLRLKETRGRNV
jgi:hypothetical protein